ncbi:PREDICTED: zinc finger BED domain-containing protein DAYSLEEPER-like [Lupinus angustifolius]|uniref:zinc finger BED domain-containing protein DAYSLEEPER-like n=1 Tax=Lupinus angustifolius TaxID=3871 RepID=UPI00092E4B37|nr:PREDICTED: zinc finger BED domain-containing protein DAYSLEEPER-like [Lupinus angustifolius]
MEVNNIVAPLPVSKAQSNTRPRKKSIVWEHFTLKTLDPRCSKAYCKQCGKEFAYITDSKQIGTSHLKRHISLGICQKNQSKNSASGGDAAAYPQKKRARAAPCVASISFDQECCNNNIAKMIILHDYPLHIVEHQGFINFVQTLQPQFNPQSFNAIKGDCVSMYLREKQNLLNLINEIPGRVNLTLDLWTSNQTLAYVFLRGHFIDSDWNLHKPILKVMVVPFPDSDNSLNQAIVSCLSNWHLEGRIFTLALDNFSSNETVVGNLRGHLSVKNPVLLNGQLLSTNCYARVLSRLALDALLAMRETVSKVRESVMYVKSSKCHESKFFELKQQLQVPGMFDLLIDEQNKWDTIYHMLVAACELKEVFACFDAFDPDYKTILTMNEWKQLETLCTHLKYLYEAAKILIAQPCPTANLFFPAVSKLHMQLANAAFSDDPFCSSLIMPLHAKFDQYWRESCLILAVAVAMDPRHKMKLVESTFAKIFGENAELWIRMVEVGLHELFVEYIIQMLPSSSKNVDEGNEAMLKTELLTLSSSSTNGDEGDEFLIKVAPLMLTSTATNGDEGNMITIEAYQEGSIDGSLFATEDELSDIEYYLSDFTGNYQFNSELNEYLEEHLEPNIQEFDVLNWWRVNGLKYPTLSRMASDILSMPISTVSADSVFDTETRKMDRYRSSLDPMTLEALICTNDWFMHESLSIDLTNGFSSSF